MTRAHSQRAILPRALALAASILAIEAPARADTPPPAADPRAEARAIAEKGDAQFDAGRCDKAIPLWKEAEAKFHAPTILLRIARCHALVGKVVAAAATLETITREPLDPDAPAAFTEAKAEAERDLKSVRARIGKLVITVDRPSDIAAEPTLEVDDTRVPAVKVEMSVDPGPHQIRVHAGDVLWERAIQIGDGEAREMHISLTSEKASSPPRTQRTVGLAIGGVGAAAAVVGVGFAVSAFVTSQHLEGACGANRMQCPPSEQGAIDRLKTHTLVADFTLAGGAALLATGVILLLTEPHPRNDAPKIRVSASALPVDLGRSPAPSGFALGISGTY